MLKLERAPQNGLNKLLHHSNQTVMGFGQPSLYTDSLLSTVDGRSRKRQAGNVGRPKGSKRAALSASTSQSERPRITDVSWNFHISIGWTLGAPTQDLRERLNSTGIDFQAIKVEVNIVKIKLGNGITAIPLASRINDSNKIIDT